MPATYSINVGTAIEAFRKPDIISVLKDLPDNTHKLISPKNVRDAFISTWASSPFKQTTNLVGIEYIGIDSGNPANRDIKQKILLGKRSYANLDIMTSALLSTDAADIYIYNTKPDSYLTQSTTKVAILAGTNSSLHQTAPYIESSTVGSNNNLEIRNPSLNKGPISIFSSTGRVAINGILFPTVAESAAPLTGAANGRILKYAGSYPNGYLKWSELTYSMTNVGSPGLPTNIYGSPVRLNGYSLEFVDSSVVPVSIGGVPSGFSFSSNSFYNQTGATYQNWPLSEVLRKVIYPYVEPKLELSIYNNDPSSLAYGTTYAEAGTSPNVSLKYDLTIYPRTSSEYVSNYYILTQEKYASTVTATQGTQYFGLSFSGLPGKTFSATLPFSISSSGNISGGQYIFTMAISNVPGTTTASYPVPPAFNNMGWSYSQSVTMNFIKPIYYGFDASSTMNVLNLSKIIKPYPGPTASMSIRISGAGYLYFAYPVQNGIGGNTLLGSLKMIKDTNGFVVHSASSPSSSAFTYSTNTVSQYHIYRTTIPCSYYGDDSFQFIF
jgi:hypothetical protein